MVSEKENAHFSELEKLVESIKQRQQVVIFPPGIASFIAVNILLIASFITFFAPVMTIIGDDWEMSQKAGGQFLVILLAVICIVPPAILITRGKKNLQRWFILLSSALAFMAALMVVVGLTMNNEAIAYQSPPLYVCIITSSLAAFLAQTSHYKTLTLFYYLLHKHE
ncbi:MAG: hypothetical protein OQK98_10545 [Gammaproteobacteria bacterium]|nr:hypothetical protein [Gammaproteobacteria bacterium]